MKYINIIKKIEIERTRKKKNHSHKFSIKKFLFNNILLIIAISLFICSIFALIFFGKSLWAFVFLLSSYYLIYFIISISFLYKSIRKELKWYHLPFNRAININVKKNYYNDKKSLNELFLLDIQQLKFGYLELNHEYLFLQKRIHLLIGPLDKLGILPGFLATLGVLPDTIETFGTNLISIFSYSYIGMMFISVFFYNIIFEYERMLALTKFVIECKEKK